MTEKSSLKANCGRRIRVLLTVKNKTQRDTARLLGISSATFSDKINGKIQFKAAEIAKLSDLLGVSADVLLGREPLEVR